MYDSDKFIKIIQLTTLTMDRIYVIMKIQHKKGCHTD